MARDIINELFQVLEERKSADPAQSYVASLYAGGADGILKKVGEEAAEFIIAGKNADAGEIIHEAADLWFHSLVLLAYYGIDAGRLKAELERRFGQPGLEEKASRQQQ